MGRKTLKKQTHLNVMKKAVKSTKRKNRTRRLRSTKGGRVLNDYKDWFGESNKYYNNWLFSKTTYNIRIKPMGCNFSKNLIEFKSDEIIVCDKDNHYFGVATGKLSSLFTACHTSGFPETSQFFTTLKDFIGNILDKGYKVHLYGHSYGGGIANQIAEKFIEDKNKKNLYVLTTGSTFISRKKDINKMNIINVIDKDDNKSVNSTCYNDTVLLLERKPRNKTEDPHNLIAGILDKRNAIFKEFTHDSIKDLPKVKDDYKQDNPLARKN